MDIGWGVEPDARVAVLVVVVLEEAVAESPGRRDVGKALGEGREVLERLELGLRVGVSLDWCGREWLWRTPMSARS
jgi:hypothetical protein